MGSLFRMYTVLAVLALSTPAVTDASAQALGAVGQPPSAAVDFDYFLQRLSPYGRWLRHPVWGDVWQPDAGPNFRPYFYGYWQYTTDYGWLWASNEPYGDIVYHYGRWAYDPNFGWIWVPGYVWGPSWVAWRDTGDYIGWLPMPPGYQDFSLGNTTPSYNPGDWYGYQYFYGNNFPLDAFASLWLFVPNQDFGRRDHRPYVFDKDKVRDLYRRSHDRTHYDRDSDHDRVVDRSIDKDELERSTHRSFGAQEGRQFLRRDTPMNSVTEGQEIARHNRERGAGRFALPAGSAGTSIPVPGAQAGGQQSGAGSDASGPRRVGRGLFAVPSVNPAAPQAGIQTSPAVQAVVPEPLGGAQTGVAQRPRPRAFLGRALPLTPASPMNVPPTDGIAGGQTPSAPGAVAPAAQSSVVSPSIVTPSGVRVRRFGSSPPVVTPPSATALAPHPVMSPSVGLQQGLSPPSAPPAPVVPRAPTPAAQNVPAPPAQSPVAMPQVPAPQSGRASGRGLMAP